jgi:hypothetical protein
MTGIDKLVRILKQHDQRFFTNRQRTQLFVEDVFQPKGAKDWCSEWHDASEWTVQDLLDWLGY